MDTKILKKNKYINLAAIIIILFQAILITILFDVRKQGYHSDELWNYGFANSTEGTQIFTKDGKHLDNCVAWMDSKKLLDYISVDKSEIFSYSSIYNNAAQDLNPPFQYMLLHFICSFFPNTWSKWFCFVINITAFIISQIYLYRFLKEITDNGIVAIAGLILYGFSVGILNISFFLRIYALGVCFVMMFVYYSYKVFEHRNDSKLQISLLVKVFLTCFLGSFTIHLFFSISFILVLMFSIYYLLSKNIKTLLKYGFTCAFAVALTILIFPSALFHMFGSSDVLEAKKYPTGWQYKIYWSFLTKDVSGFHNSALYTMTKNYVFVGVVIAAFIITPICFLSRNEIWFKDLVSKAIARAKHLWKNKHKFPYIIIVLLVSINFFIYIDAAHTSIPRMGLYGRRYIFLIYPLYAALFTLLIHYFFRTFIVKRKILNILSIIIALVSASLTYVYSGDFFSFRHKESGIHFDKIEKDANCIMLFNDIWILTCATNELYDTNSYYAAPYTSYKQDNYCENIDTEKPLYLILDISTFIDSEYIYNLNGVNLQGSTAAEEFGLRTDKDEILKYYENLPISTKLELVGEDALYDRIFEIYRLN